VDSLIPLDVPIEREYDPLWPNDYEKVVKEVREVKSRNKAVNEIAAVNKSLGIEVVDPEEKRLQYLVSQQLLLCLLRAGVDILHKFTRFIFCTAFTT
jgi:hypothetical protein